MTDAATDRAELVVQWRLNGEDTTIEVPQYWTLADALRERAGLTGLHLGCEHGVCGACTVLLDGEPVRSCIVLAAQADGHEVRTIEGLAGPESERLHAVQEAFTEHHALQCGYCTPGFIMLAVSILEREPDAEPGADQGAALGEPLPLHRIQAHRRRGALGATCDRRAVTGTLIDSLVGRARHPRGGPPTDHRAPASTSAM